MAVPSGLIAMHPGTAASIAAGWSRVSSLDGRYIKGTAAGVDPDVTGGALTHTHTSPSHGNSHTIAAHTHAGNAALGGYSGGTNNNVGGTSDAASISHTHTVGTSSSASGSANILVPATWQSASNEPAYIEVIFIMSDGSPAGIANGDWAFWSGGSVPTGWTLPAAAQNRHPKGAPAAGDGGGTGGGATHHHVADVHSHTSTHTHTVTSGSSGVQNNNDSPHTQVTVGDHTHTVTFGGLSATGAAASADTGDTTYEPAWKKLGIVQNGTGGADIPQGLILLTLGLLSSIPSGFALCDGLNSTPDMRGSFVKGVAALGEVGATGGTTGHDHTDPATHTHTGAHTHTLTTDTSAKPLSGQVPLSGTVAVNHSHQGSSASGGPASTGAEAQTVDATTDTQPPYRTVAFVMVTTSLVTTITTPTTTVNQPAFPVAWNLAFNPAAGAPVQVSFRVRIYDAAGTSLQYDSGVIASATQGHTIGSWAPINATNYLLRVDVTDSTGLDGTDFEDFTTSWTGPASITGLSFYPIGGV